MYVISDWVSTCHLKRKPSVQSRAQGFVLLFSRKKCNPKSDMVSPNCFCAIQKRTHPYTSEAALLPEHRPPSCESVSAITPLDVVLLSNSWPLDCWHAHIYSEDVCTKLQHAYHRNCVCSTSSTSTYCYDIIPSYKYDTININNNIIIDDMIYDTRLIL